MLYYVMYLMKYQSNIYYSKVIWEIVVLEIIIIGNQSTGF